MGLFMEFISNMGNFNGKKKFGGRTFGGGNRSEGRSEGSGERKTYAPRDREEGAKSQMHKATCHDCGKNCEVPFRPTGSRPIFCSTCFDKQGSSGPSKFAGKSFDRPRFQDKRKHEFERENAVLENKMADQQKAQFAQLHEKMDRILSILDTYFASKAAEVMTSLEEDIPAEKPAFKMKKKVSGVKKTTKKKA